MDSALRVLYVSVMYALCAAVAISVIALMFYIPEYFK